MELPKLYKYRWFNEEPVSEDGLPGGNKIPQWNSVLYNGIIIPASPETFNDPRDCDFTLDDNFMNSNFAKNSLIYHLSIRGFLSETERVTLFASDNMEADLNKLLWMKFRLRLKNLYPEIRNQVGQYISNVKKNFIVACFSACGTNTLMWSHYAQNHTGFAIEYDLNRWDCKKYIYPVQYTEKPHIIPWNFADEAMDVTYKQFIDAAVHKAEDWKYEQEWRFVSLRPDLNRTNNIYICNLKDYITGIYLGINTAKDYVEQICAHYSTSGIPIYKMTHTREQYDLIPEQIQ